ncbi:MAG: molybdopterin-dependent oxidoreductase [Clostridiales Family XIII bacterium]|nr:molybdopterin-dependent oxidoreductase [Clostridiales Family XIII bacterium]
MNFSENTQRIKTACRACHGGCGAIVSVDGDRAVKIEPDPDAPLSKGRMCPKGLAALDLLYSPDRLKSPMKRAGERGQGHWTCISWEDAYGIIIKNIEKVRKEHGIQSVALGQGTGRHHFHHMARFAHSLGTPNWFEPGTAQCYHPRVTNFFLTYGHPLVVDYYGDVNPAYILVWGSNPVVSGADGEIPFRTRDAIRKGSKLLVVDPRKTPLAEIAEVWLQIRPGTDCALAMGMLRVIINENLYDKAFVEKWTYGFEELRKRVQAYSTKRVSEITWIPEQDIIRASRLFAEAGSASLELGCAIEHTPNCFDAVRAISFLPGITGNYDRPGGFIEGMKMMPDCDVMLENLAPEIAEKRLGAQQYPFLAGTGMHFPSAHVPTVFEAVRTGLPYPVKALLLFGNNGLLGFADSVKTFEVFKKVDFLCCMDLFMTPTAEMCDLVLPAASWLELDAVLSAPFFAGHTVMAQKKILRIHNCKADEEVFCELSERMGLNYGAKDVHEILDAQLKITGERYPEFKGLDFARLCEQNYLQIPMEYMQYEKRGRLDTPTGKMEIWSTEMEKKGLDPLPKYMEPPESPYSTPDLAKEYPLVLTTGGRSPFFFLSEGRQLPFSRSRTAYPRIEIHPETAGKHGIEDGDWVYVETRRGRITQKASVTENIDPRVVNCQHGWWYPEDLSADHGWRESNVNILTNADPPYDPVMGTYQLRALLCRISRNDSAYIEQRFIESEIGAFCKKRL